MIRILIANWWLLLLRGAFAIWFAVFVLILKPFVPTLFLKAVAYTGIAMLFGVFAAVTGLITIAASLRGSQWKHHAWLLFLDGIVIATAGLCVMFIPNLSLPGVIRLIAATAIIGGALEIIAGSHVRRHLADEWLLISGGLVSMAFATYLFFFVTRDVESVLTWIAVYALVTGTALAALSVRLRGLRHSAHMLAEHAVTAGK